MRILNLDRTIVYTRRATGAFVLQDISGLFNQGDPEVPSFAFYLINFGIAQDLYVGIPADLDQFGREYSHGAVIGRKGLVKLGHMAANGRRLVHQVNLKTCGSKIKGGLNTTDPSSDNHHVSQIACYEALANLVFNFLQFLFHFSSPHLVPLVPKI